MKTPNLNRWPFRRKRSQARPKIPLRALSSRVARKRSEWAWLYNDIGTNDGNPEASCLIRCLEFGTTCNPHEPVRIPIMTKEMLAETFQDTVTISKMRGFALWKPEWPNLSPCVGESYVQINNNLAAMQYPIFLRSYLQKQNVASVQVEPTYIDPLEGEDWTDRSGVLKEWNHTWFPDGRLAAVWPTPWKAIGVCSDTSQIGYTVPPTATGNQSSYNVPAVATDCEPVFIGEGCTIQELKYDWKQPQWYRQSLNRNRPIDLKEDDDLSIFVNWSTPRYDDGFFCQTIPDCALHQDGNLPCRMSFILQLKVEYQYG